MQYHKIIIIIVNPILTNSWSPGVDCIMEFISTFLTQAGDMFVRWCQSGSDPAYHSLCLVSAVCVATLVALDSYCLWIRSGIHQLTPQPPLGLIVKSPEPYQPYGPVCWLQALLWSNASTTAYYSTDAASYLQGLVFVHKSTVESRLGRVFVILYS